MDCSIWYTIMTIMGHYDTQLIREEADQTVHVCGRHHGVEVFTQGLQVHSPLDGGLVPTGVYDSHYLLS